MDARRAAYLDLLGIERWELRVPAGEGATARARPTADAPGGPGVDLPPPPATVPTAGGGATARARPAADSPGGPGVDLPPPAAAAPVAGGGAIARAEPAADAPVGSGAAVPPPPATLPTAGGGAIARARPAADSPGGPGVDLPPPPAAAPAAGEGASARARPAADAPVGSGAGVPPPPTAVPTVGEGATARARPVADAPVGSGAAVPPPSSAVSAGSGAAMASGASAADVPGAPAGAVPLPPAAAVAAGADVATLPWAALESAVAGCRRCALAGSRTQTVFGTGAREAEWMVIGEAPGAEEDRRGEPFVGRAGQLLDAMLAAAGPGRGGVFIANVLKCRPPRNRDPSAEESQACRPYLERQIALLAPRIILCLGRVAAQNLLRTDEPISKLRGRVWQFGEPAVPLVVTYHPAYLLRSPREKRKAWHDLLLARRALAGALS